MNASADRAIRQAIDRTEDLHAEVINFLKGPTAGPKHDLLQHLVQEVGALAETIGAVPPRIDLVEQSASDIGQTLRAFLDQTLASLQAHRDLQ